MADEFVSSDSNWVISLIQGTTAVPKSVAKLIDTVGEQLGLFLEPVHIRRRVQAVSNAILTDAKAKAEVAVGRVDKFRGS